MSFPDNLRAKLPRYKSGYWWDYTVHPSHQGKYLIPYLKNEKGYARQVFLFHIAVEAPEMLSRLYINLKFGIPLTRIEKQIAPFVYHKIAKKRYENICKDSYDIFHQRLYVPKEIVRQEIIKHRTFFATYLLNATWDRN